MNRIQLACCALIASAFVLAGLVIVQLDNNFQLENQASADMVNHRGKVTFLTARIRDNEEGLFVLHGPQEKLAIYRTDTNKDTIELVHSEDIAKLFEQAGPKEEVPSKKRGSRTRNR